MKFYQRKEFYITFTVIVLFILSSYLSTMYESEISQFVSHKSISGIFIYTLITAATVVLAPISTLPLLPVAATIWGSNIAALLSIAGWMIGAWIAFVLARRFGQDILCNLMKICNLGDWKNKFPEKNLFWAVVLARVVLPVDILSYVIGIFTSMHVTLYLLATLIGITPFAYVFAYGSKLPVWLQIISIVSLIALIALNYKYIKKIFDKKKT